MSKEEMIEADYSARPSCCENPNDLDHPFKEQILPFKGQILPYMRPLVIT